MTDTCVCCGAPVPEGRMVCWQCEHKDWKDWKDWDEEEEDCNGLETRSR